MKKFKVFLMLLVIMPFAAVLSACGEAEVESISLLGSPGEHYKVEYDQYEELDLTGMEIKVKYSGSRSYDHVDVKPSMVSGFDSTIANTVVEVTVKYEGKTTTFNVYINEHAEFYKPTSLKLKSSTHEINGKYSISETEKTLKEIVRKDLLMTDRVWKDVISNVVKGESGVSKQLAEAFYAKFNVKASADSSMCASFETRLEDELILKMNQNYHNWMVSESSFGSGMSTLLNTFTSIAKEKFAAYFYANPSITNAEISGFWNEELGKTSESKYVIKQELEDEFDAMITRIIKFVISDVQTLELKLYGDAYEKISLRTTLYGDLFTNKNYYVNTAEGADYSFTFLNDAALNSIYNIDTDGESYFTIKIVGWDNVLGYNDNRFKTVNIDDEVVDVEFAPYKGVCNYVRGIFIGMLDSVTLSIV